MRLSENDISFLRSLTSFKKMGFYNGYMPFHVARSCVCTDLDGLFRQGLVEEGAWSSAIKCRGLRLTEAGESVLRDRNH